MNPRSIHAARTNWHAAPETQELDVANALMEQTQQDSIWRLASRKIRVLACDMASRMIEQRTIVSGCNSRA
jgi:hypothetical protein